MKKLDLSKLPEITRGRFDRIKVFSDFLELAAIRISNSIDPVHYKERDERAKTIIKEYTEAERAEMYRYFEDILLQIQKNCKYGRCEDILSHVFESSGFSRKGQDQSPHDLAKLVAKLSVNADFKIPEKGFIELDEPACGSGSLILAFAEEMTANNFNYCKQLVVRATDVDPKCEIGRAHV
jgi:hypothetical protein